MPRLPKQNYRDIERIIEFDFVRATEAAALNALPWLGRGEKEKADAAACDAMRGMFDLMNICGEVVIGEGIKDDAPGILKGEQLGTWLPGAAQFDIASAKGLPPMLVDPGRRQLVRDEQILDGGDVAFRGWRDHDRVDHGGMIVHEECLVR